MANLSLRQPRFEGVRDAVWTRRHSLQRPVVLAATAPRTQPRRGAQYGPNRTGAYGGPHSTHKEAT